jgi:dynein heavy chain
MSNPRRSAPHWKEIFTRCEVKEIEISDELSLGKLLEVGMPKFREVIEDVSKKAEKQWAIEKKLKEMEDKVKE